MAKYSDIKGFTVQTLASDTAASAISGATWSSGGDLNTARTFTGRTGGGTQTAAIVASGNVPPNTGATERYDGTSWTEVNDLNTARSSCGMGGNYTSALVAAGYTSGNVDVVESWDGSSWTEIAEVNTARRQLGMATTGSNSTVILVGV